MQSRNHSHYYDDINEYFPLVSVIINCHNGANFLREAIDSVRQQTYTKWEIILWDNRSTDNSAEIFHEYLDARMHYFLSPEFTSLGMARNLAVNSSKGDWIAFLDCDDLWAKDKLSSQIELILNENSDLGFVYGKALVMFDGVIPSSVWSRKLVKYSKNSLVHNLLEGDVFGELLKINFVPLLTAIVRKDLYLKVGGVSPYFVQSEDYDLFVKIAAISRARAVQHVIAYYRVHNNNTTHCNVEIGYSEAMDSVKNYLPDPRAKSGIIHHQTYYSIYLISNKNYAKGIKKLLFQGSLMVLIKISLTKFLKYLKFKSKLNALANNK